MLARYGWRAFSAWKRLQVSYCGGKYSIQRALTLEAYAKSTSPLHIFLICFGTLLPMVALVLIQELIPLQDPRGGWRVNYGFWVRATILLATGVRTLTVQATYFIDGVQISLRRQVGLAVCVSIVMTAFSVTIASNVIFPIPFFVVSTAPIMCVVHLVFFRVIVGGRVMHHMVTHRSQLAHYSNFVNAQAFMALVFPAYEALFRATEGSKYQLLVILLLPLIKVGIKNIVLRCTAQLEDMMPEAVIFTVDLFNEIYMATCMQSASSVATIAAITVTDQVQSLVMLYGLHRRTATILPRLCETIGAKAEGNNLLTALGLLCQDPDKFEKQTQRGIRKRSCLPHAISEKDLSLLEMLNKNPNKTGSINVHYLIPAQAAELEPISIPKCCPLRCCSSRRFRSSIHPAASVFTTPDSGKEVESRMPDSLPGHDVSVAHRSILQESLEVLFTTECLIIAAYLEFAIPLLYCCYILVMVRLPSARYHSEMAGITKENAYGTIFPLFVFGLLQILSFAVLTAIIKRNCGTQALRQLAFVLETQMPLIQDKLLFWPTMTFCFRVVHFGVDFTFKFAQH